MPQTTHTTRTRSALSPQKQLAIIVAQLLSVVNRKEVAATLRPEDKAVIEVARKVSDEYNAKTIKPVVDRINAIEKEFRELLPNISKPGSPEKAKELSIELARLQKRHTTLTEAATATRIAA